ncbi:MAG: hypothetical protein ACREEW_03350 [Caulobacteraceae bacterium]
MFERRQLVIWGYAFAAWIGAFAIMLGPRLWLAPHHAQVFDFGGWILLRSGLVAAGVIWTLVFVRLAWRRSDEYMREASKFAWHWGGAFGLVAALPVYSFIEQGGLHWLWPLRFHMGADLALAFRMGFGVAVFAQAVGFLIAWAVWRCAKGRAGA